MKRIEKFCFCIALLISLAVTAGAAASVPAAVMKAQKSVVRIQTEYSEGTVTGSGFVVLSNDTQTLLVTNYHVVEGDFRQISVWVEEGISVPGEILAYSDQKDLAVLKLGHPVSLEALTLSSNGAGQGDAVYAVGFPGAADFLSDGQTRGSADATITDGIVSALRETSVSGHGTPVSILQISAPINPGSSGGPLFNEKGEVVGVNTFGIVDAQGIFGAISAEEAAVFLEDNGISFSGRSSWPLILGIAGIGILAMAVLAVFFWKRNALRRNVESAAKGKAALSRGKKTVLAAGCLLLCLFLLCSTGAFAFALGGRFGAADTLLRLSPVTKVCAPRLAAYVQAGKAMADRNFSAAREQFAALPGYLNAENLAREADCRYAMQRAEANDFDTAIRILQQLPEAEYGNLRMEVQYRKGNYLLYEKGDYTQAQTIFRELAECGYAAAADMEKEVQYLWAVELTEQGDLPGAYHKLEPIRGYSDTDEVLEVLAEAIYLEGQNQYRNGQYGSAKTLFHCIEGYRESDKYITLIHARNETGATAGVNIEELCRLFGFEDTAEVALCNQAVAQKFLEGTWLGSGYFFTMEADGNLDYDLPWIPYGDYYKIENGILLLFPENKEKDTRKQFCFTAVSPEKIKVFCYSNQKTYTLYRQ